MSDTIRSQAALLSIFANNTTGAITAQNIRDFVVSAALVTYENEFSAAQHFDAGAIFTAGEAEAIKCHGADNSAAIQSWITFDDFPICSVENGGFAGEGSLITNLTITSGKITFNNLGSGLRQTLASGVAYREATNTFIIGQQIGTATSGTPLSRANTPLVIYGNDFGPVLAVANNYANIVFEVSASGIITAGGFASGTITGAGLSSGSVTSGNIASGQIGRFHMSSGAIVSGSVASGQIGHRHLASGVVLQNAENRFGGTQTFVGSFGDPNITVENSVVDTNIFQYLNSGNLSVSTYIYYDGTITAPGFYGNGSGLTNLTITSGKITSGHIASGQIGQFHLRNNAPQQQTTPTNTSGTTNSSGLMLGYGQSFTPAHTGKVLAIVTGCGGVSAADIAGKYQLRYGSGTAPGYGSGLTGTVLGPENQFFSANSANVRTQFTTVGNVSGLTPGVPYWFDLSLGAVSGGTATVFDANFVLNEIY